MGDTKKIEELEKELSTVKEKYEFLLKQFETIYKHYAEGYKMADSILTNIKMKDLFLPNYIQSLFNKMEEFSKKIREDAIDGEIEFDDIQQDVFLTNYKESFIDEEKIYRITDNLICNDITSKYGEILKIVEPLNIPEDSVIVKKKLKCGTWSIINPNDSSVIFSGKVNYKE